ncbi:DUF4184 family protein [Rufibacter immobilis]|uniref:DUF4184 family protein n=1 Tax=Rufibacter immobilis TaxID=1348778 RepID=A0A3M9MR20_9BACT|nr:DUF4184 family protein [Rufibacter immobilis]RNI27951.1 DUF4184 family protein [Rufibacter immobilis]
MPFTFSHAAVVLPFKSVPGDKVSLTAMALGSMAPDFEFFFRMRAETDISHTLKGIYLFDIPVVLALAFLYHCWVRNAFIEHLPPFLQKKLVVYKSFDWLVYFKKNWLVVITSAFLGVVTHLLCDDFTHYYGWTANNFNLLATSYLFFGMKVPGYHLLQYLSSVVLGLYLLIDLIHLPSGKATLQWAALFRYWGLVSFITIAVFALRFLLREREMIPDDLIMTAIAAGLAGIVTASTVANVAKKRANF